MKKLICLLALTVLVSGCATMQTTIASRGKGIKRQYEYGYNDVYKAMLKSVYKQGAKIEEQSMDEGYLYASHGMTLWSWGERTAIFVTKIDNNTTEVEIVSRKVVSPLNFAPDWANKIFMGIDASLR